jgi:NAD(P)-dependent dehydrogenase (short-subunit alcohol dehydrogenase family)
MPNGGSIINITSVHEHFPRPNFSVYAAAKAAEGMLSKALALELADKNIRVTEQTGKTRRGRRPRRVARLRRGAG